jgi:acrylyl-CoA reductase (NADPH)
VVVIGAAGAPARAAVAILSHRGFQVTASNGRLQEVDRSRKRMRERDRRTQRVRRTRKNPCKKGVARTLSIPSAQSRSPTLLATTRHGGAVAARGWAGGVDLPISVAPFILCGASLFGIESVMSPIAD